MDSYMEIVHRRRISLDNSNNSKGRGIIRWGWQIKSMEWANIKAWAK